MKAKKEKNELKDLAIEIAGGLLFLAMMAAWVWLCAMAPE